MYSAHFNFPSLRVAPNFMYETLAVLEPILLDPAPPLPAIANVPDDVSVWVKRVGGQTVLIAVNLLNRPLDATITCEGLRNVKELRGLRQPTRVTPTNGVLTLPFEPYQVHLLCDPPLGAGMTTEADAEREIADIVAGLRKPGNLLYGRGREIAWSSSDTYVSNRTLFSLVDGLCDVYGWANWSKPGLPQWIEMRMPPPVPTFRRLVFHTSTVVDMDVQTWKNNAWTTLHEIRGNTATKIEVTFPAAVETDSLRFLFLKTRPNTRAELYEVEMYE